MSRGLKPALFLGADGALKRPSFTKGTKVNKATKVIEGAKVIKAARSPRGTSIGGFF